MLCEILIFLLILLLCLRQIKVNKSSFGLSAFLPDKAKNVGDAGHRRGFLTKYGRKTRHRIGEFIILICLN